MKILPLDFRPYTADGYIINEIFTQDCYLSSLIDPGMTVVDIGAHIGCFSALAIERGATVIAYEPDPENFKLLSVNCPTAKLHNQAVLFEPISSDITYRLHRPEFNTGGGYVNQEIGTPVEVAQFGGIIYNYRIDWLKIDIEGGEVKLLDHPDYLTSEYIALETHNNTFDAFYNFLYQHGYRFLKTAKNNDLGLLVGRRV